MPADVRVVRLTGAGPVETDITGATTRSSISDDPDPGINNPLVRPSSGASIAFWVSTQLKAETTPDGTINNIRWYTDGSSSYGSGVTTNGGRASSYVQATGVEGVNGDSLSLSTYPSLIQSTTIFSRTVGSPFALGGSISNPDTGRFGELMVYQHRITSTVSVTGNLPAETFTWIWDET